MVKQIFIEDEEPENEIIDDATPVEEPSSEVVEKPKKKRVLSDEQKQRVLENLRKGREKAAERRKKNAEAKKLKQQLKDVEQEEELEQLREKVKTKREPKKEEIKEDPSVNWEQKYKERDEEFNKLKSFVVAAEKRGREMAAERNKPKEQHSNAPAPVKQQTAIPHKPVYKYNFASGKMEWM